MWPDQNIKCLCAIFKVTIAGIDGCSKELILAIACNKMHLGFSEFIQKQLQILDSGGCSIILFWDRSSVHTRRSSLDMILNLWSFTFLWNASDSTFGWNGNVTGMSVFYTHHASKLVDMGEDLKYRIWPLKVTVEFITLKKSFKERVVLNLISEIFSRLKYNNKRM